MSTTIVCLQASGPLPAASRGEVPPGLLAPLAEAIDAKTHDVVPEDLIRQLNDLLSGQQAGSDLPRRN